MSPQTFLALKFLSSKHRSFLVSFLTLMALLGVVVSVAAFLVVQGVMLGFSHDLRDKILGFSPHLSFVLSPSVSDPASIISYVESQSEVAGWERYLEGEGILQYNEEALGIKVRGIDFQKIPNLKNISTQFEEGEDWKSLQAQGDDLPGILLGRELSASEGIFPILYDSVQVLYPLGEVGPTGELEPVQRSFRIIGTFKSGYYDYDSKMAILDLSEAKRLFADQGEERFGLFLTHPEKASQLKEVLQKNPKFQELQIWTEQQGRLFSALKLERIGMTLVLVLMMLLASFNIVSMLFLVAHERRREIAILKAIGMSNAHIKGIFLRAGLWIGGLGGMVGVVLGILLCRWIASSHIPLPTPYYLDALPVDLRGVSILLTFGLALMLGILAAVIPAREGRKVSVVEALRYE
jgi:lipoprotein-releasing system permease protein